MGETQAVVVYSTFPDETSAKKIGHQLIADRLAACVNIFPAMTSLYEWKGEMQQDHEIAVLFKTTKSKCSSLIEALEKRHPYETPAIIGFDVTCISASYLSWLQEQTMQKEA